MQEVKLAETRAERDLQDSLAEIFSIIVTIDELEKAFLKDAIPEAEYTEICERALKQYKSLIADETVAKAFVGLEEFKAEWDVSPLLVADHPGLAHETKEGDSDGSRINNSSKCPVRRRGYESACPRRR